MALERHRSLSTEILLHLIGQGPSTVSELSEHLGASEGKVEAAVKSLVSKCTLINEFATGDVVLYGLFTKARSYLRRQDSCHREKAAIAHYVVDNFVSKHDRLYLGGGSNCFYIALVLSKSDMYTLHVLTSNLWAAGILSEAVAHVYTIPGRIAADWITVAAADWFDFRQERYTLAITGCDGVAYPDGVYTSESFANQMRNAVFNASDLIIILADHTKLGRKLRGRAFSFDELKQASLQYLVVTDEAQEWHTKDPKYRAAVKSFPRDKLIAVDTEGTTWRRSVKKPKQTQISVSRTGMLKVIGERKAQMTPRDIRRLREQIRRGDIEEILIDPAAGMVQCPNLELCTFEKGLSKRLLYLLAREWPRYVPSIECWRRVWPPEDHDRVKNPVYGVRDYINRKLHDMLQVVGEGGPGYTIRCKYKWSLVVDSDLDESLQF